MTLNENQQQALRILNQNMSILFADDLSGPRFKHVRQQILSLVTGQKVPVAKSGVNNLWSALYKLLEVNPDCTRNMMEEFRSKLQTVIAN